MVSERGVTPDPKQAEVAVDMLDLRAIWIRKSLEADEEIARQIAELQKCYCKAKLELTKG